MRLPMRLLCAAAAIAMVTGCTSSLPPGVEMGGPTVRFEVGDGIGSGVYIGNGTIITAAHVVGNNKKVTIRSDVGDAQQAEVLWVNPGYDIAAVRPEKPERLRPAFLNCRIPRVGEQIRAEGNPMGLAFISMSGYVAGKEQEIANWRSVVVMDLTTLPGMSGGPVFSEFGDVVAITVATQTAAGGAPVAMGLAVPGSAVCSLLGRVVVG